MPEKQHNKGGIFRFFHLIDHWNLTEPLLVTQDGANYERGSRYIYHGGSASNKFFIR